MVTIYQGDCLDVLRRISDDSVHCCVTSPPYWGLRDYGVAGQIGVEESPDEYVKKLVDVFMEVYRVLRADGTLWLNLGDSYADGGRGADTGSTLDGTRHNQAETRKSSVRQKYKGLPEKNLIGLPWRVALALQSAGWYLRCDIIWNKPNPMPESVTDRPTRAHEYIFLMTKSERYFYDAEAICEKQVEYERTRRLREQERGLDTRYQLSRDDSHGQTKPGKNGVARSVAARQALAVKGTRNKRSVWTVPTKAYRGAHFATFPPALIRPCIRAGCPAGGTVLDVFGGSGTTGEVSEHEGRDCILIELNPAYVKLAEKRTEQTGLFTRRE